MTSVVISGSGFFAPDTVIDNEELVASYNQHVAEFNAEHASAIAAEELPEKQPSSPEFILKASGIERRHVLNKSGVLATNRLSPELELRDDEQLGIQAEMAVAAARDALKAADKDAADIDMLLVACSNMQRAYPAVAIEVQNALGCGGYAYDLNVACSSATFGLQAAVAAVTTGQAKCALVISPEICSAHLNFSDRDCHFIFGDACTALLIESRETCTVSGAWEVLDTKLFTQFSNNIRNNFGFLNSSEQPARDSNDKLFKQNGRSVFKEVSPAVASLIGERVEALGLEVDDIARFWLHQANLNMNNLIAKRILGRDATDDEAPVVLNEYANTSSAGCVIAFHQHNADLPAGSIGVMSSFGAGYSIGCAIVKRLP